MTRCRGTLVVALLTLLSFEAAAQGADSDNDGIPDEADNCVLAPNQGQHDADQDLYGDACDADLNNDGAVDFLDLGEFKQRFGTNRRAADFNGDGYVDFLDLGRFKSLFGRPPGPRGLSASEVDAPTLLVDTALLPTLPDIAGVDGGPRRPLDRIATATDGFDIVRDEVVLRTADFDELVALASRWSGSLLFEVKSEAIQPGEPRLFLLRIDPTAADTSRVGADLAALDGRIHGKHVTSSARALRLVSAVAYERRVNGLDLSLNALLLNDDLAARESLEAPLASSEPDGTPYQRDAFRWPYLERDPDLPGDSLYPLDTGVAEAWRVLRAAGRLLPQVRVAIADAGFWPNEDFPPFTTFGPLRVENTTPCGGALSEGCRTHGTHVVTTGFALPDNRFGAAGPGGPVSELILAQSPSMDIAAIVRYIAETIPGVVGSRPRVLNISASVAIPSGWCFLACEPLDFIASLARREGILTVASAGNETRDVDATDEFCFFRCVPFENATVVPCETDHVLCIGALDFSRSSIAAFSNRGSDLGDDNSVDLYAPGVLWSVDARDADIANPSPSDFLDVIQGTSFSAPFVAGVAALVMAADPARPISAVQACLLTRAHRTGWSGPYPRVDALGAVRCALGGTHPFLNITSPAEGDELLEGATALVIRAAADDLEDGSALVISWSSDLEGHLALTAPGAGLSLGAFRLRQGFHRIRASVTDRSGRTTTDEVRIEVGNPAPTVEAILPLSGSRFYLSQTIDLVATSFDANAGPGESGPLDDAQIRWGVSGVTVATGHVATISAASLGVGPRVLTVYAEDDQGVVDFDAVTVQIDPDPANLPPNVQILQPAPYTDFGFVDTPFTFEIRWSASDPEDGLIPFAALRWYVSTNGATEVPLTLTSTVVCVEFDPILGCVRTDTVYRTTLGPGEHRIRVEANDSLGEEGEDSAVVVIRDLI